MSVMAAYLGGSQRRQMEQPNMMDAYADDGIMSGSEARDWSRFAEGGATRPDSFTNMDPRMQSGLYAFLEAAEAELGPGLSVYSGYRSPELQASLYQNALEKYGNEAEARKWVAPPGRSQHNFGRAADLKFNGARLDQDPRAAAWVRANAPRFGLHVPMKHEPWQVELFGSRG